MKQPRPVKNEQCLPPTLTLPRQGGGDSCGQGLKQLLLFPFNGNAREAASVVAAINAVGPKWELLGFVDDSPGQAGKDFGGYTVLGGREVLSQQPEALVLAVPGRPENFRHRAALIDSLGLPTERFATIIHPSVGIGLETTIGHNTLIMNNCVLTAKVRIGNHVVILPNTVVAHDSRIGDYSLLGSNISISGGVAVAENCYVGSGSKLIQAITIGPSSLVGLGSVVIRDVPADAVFAGNPSRRLKAAP